jgi:hypothetical protein
MMLTSEESRTSSLMLFGAREQQQISSNSSRLPLLSQIVEETALRERRVLKLKMRLKKVVT